MRPLRFQQHAHKQFLIGVQHCRFRPCNPSSWIDSSKLSQTGIVHSRWRKENKNEMPNFGSVTKSDVTSWPFLAGGGTERGSLACAPANHRQRLSVLHPFGPLACSRYSSLRPVSLGSCNHICYSTTPSFLQTLATRVFVFMTTLHGRN